MSELQNWTYYKMLVLTSMSIFVIGAEFGSWPLSQKRAKTSVDFSNFSIADFFFFSIFHSLECRNETYHILKSAYRRVIWFCNWSGVHISTEKPDKGWNRGKVFSSLSCTISFSFLFFYSFFLCGRNAYWTNFVPLASPFILLFLLFSFFSLILGEHHWWLLLHITFYMYFCFFLHGRS